MCIEIILVAPAGLFRGLDKRANGPALDPSGVRIIAGMSNVRFKINTSRVTSVRTVTITISSGLSCAFHECHCHRQIVPLWRLGT